MANGQLWEIDSQGNKKQISGMVTGELPKYTMAEYLALTDKPIDWICTDYDATSEYGINATEVKYGNTNVKQALDDIVITVNISGTTDTNGLINLQSIIPSSYVPVMATDKLAYVTTFFNGSTLTYQPYVRITDYNGSAKANFQITDVPVLCIKSF